MLRLFKYRLPFKNTFRTSAGSYTQREGIILSYQKENLVAYGEVAPLPGFSTESADQVTTVLKTNQKKLSQAIEDDNGKEILTVLHQIHRFPSLSFGLDTLLSDLKAKQRNISLSQLLYQSEPKPVECNITIPLNQKETSLQQVSDGLDDGFRTFKFKVGADFLLEKEILETIRDRYPEIRIRIDANQAWTVEEACKNLKSVEHLNIEYCEQPVSEKSIDKLKSVKNQVSVPIAADESVRSPGDAKEIIQHQAADVIILKPMLFGLLSDIFVTNSIANSHNIEVVFTTALESGIGRTVTAMIASALGSKRFAHGLATNSFFESNFVHNHNMENGFFTFSGGPGLGISVDLSNLEEISG